MSSVHPDPLPEPDDATAEQPRVPATDSFPFSALEALEHGPHAPRCPQGHGRLVTAANPSAATGVSLSCPACGFQQDLDVDLLRDLNRSLDRAGSPAPPERPPTQRPHHATMLSTNTTTPRPRGLKPDGTVRTRGGLHVYGWTTPAGGWAPLVGLLAGLLLTGGQWWWSLLSAAATYGLWYGATRWIWPSTLAVNRQRCHAEHLQPGTWIRLHGATGPVGRVERISTRTSPAKVIHTGRGHWVRIGFTGGTFLDLPSRTACRIVELRD